MDVPHGAGNVAAPYRPPSRDEAHPPLPRDDDERFIVGLVLTYYRRHPQRARTRLLDLLGEALTPPRGGEPPAARPAAPAVPAEPPNDEQGTLVAHAEGQRGAIETQALTP